MAKRKVLTMQELQDIIENEWSDDDEITAVTVLPPPNVDALSDEEFLDDDEIPMNDNVIINVQSFVVISALQIYFLYFVLAVGKCHARNGRNF